MDLEKAYDRVPRVIVYWALRRKGVEERLIRLIQDENFGVEVGLHQGSALSPFLFIIVLDALLEFVTTQKVVELLYADDLVILAETEEALQEGILKWQEDLEKGGLKVNAKKTEVMVTKKGEEHEIEILDTHGNRLQQVRQFRYLGSVVTNGGGTEVDVRERVKTAWRKWKEIIAVICDPKISVSKVKAVENNS